MSKKPKTYNLCRTIIKVINEEALKDGRKDSDWLNRYLTKQLLTEDVPVEEKALMVAKKKQFTKPTMSDIGVYMMERGNFDSSEAERFFDFYESKGWMVGKNKMKCWKAAVRNWLKGKQGVKEKSTSSNWHLEDQGF